jgi:hypothetical protein
MAELVRRQVDPGGVEQLSCHALGEPVAHLVAEPLAGEQVTVAGRARIGRQSRR